MEWEAASEKLGNALGARQPGLPTATPEEIRACFDLLQKRLDALRAAWETEWAGGEDEDEDADPVGDGSGT